MASDSPRDRFPVRLQLFGGLCFLCILILAPIALSWYVPAPPPFPADEPVHLKILAINDFHGQLPPGQTMNMRPVGGDPVMAAYLTRTMEGGGSARVIIALPGDIVGASPPESGLLLDEPTMLFFNSFANLYCPYGSEQPCNSCNMVATLGNHEFDQGVAELMRKIEGGDGSTNIIHLENPYPGTKSTYVCANVVWKTNNTLLLPPYTLRNVGGVPVAFIGADTVDTPRIQVAANVEDVHFLDEAAAINRYIPEIQSQGVHAIIVLLHEGGSQVPYNGSTQVNGTVTGRVADIIPRLDPDIDVVLTGHTHAFTNVYLDNAGGKPVLLTQAFSYSKGYADIDLLLDRATGEIIGKSAQIITAYADQSPGTNPDPLRTVYLVVDEEAIGPQVNQVIGIAATDITRDQDPAGECALGDLVADGQRASMNTDVGFLTTGSLRADISQGNITWGDLYSVQPFASTVQSMTLSGEQIVQVLEQQWEVPLPPHNLAVSGLTYLYNATGPAGERVVDVKIHGQPLDPKAAYTASLVDFLAGGGDGYTVFKQGQNITNGPSDVNALVAYVGSLPQPVSVSIEERIQMVT